jgi:hypothetical protein
MRSRTWATSTCEGPNWTLARLVRGAAGKRTLPREFAARVNAANQASWPRCSSLAATASRS